MPTNPYLTGTIAGVHLTDDGSSGGNALRAYLIDGGNVVLGAVGVLKFAASGKPKAQVLNTGQKGASIGVKIDICTLAFATALYAAIVATITGSNTFAIALSTPFESVSGNAVWDWNSQPRGPAYPGDQRIWSDSSGRTYLKDYTVRMVLAS